MGLIVEHYKPRLWSITGGRVMVVTDLHGNWDIYRRYRDHFVNLYDSQDVDGLILTGDMIHAQAPTNDQSVEIVLDIIQLRQNYGTDVLYLCGNHELPHIYGISLAKGNRVYTPDFEQAMERSGNRDKIISLFDSLPFYLRTRAGVSLTHAGAPAILTDPTAVERLFDWSHQWLLQWAEEQMGTEDIEELRAGYAKLHDNVPYHLLAQYFLAIAGPDDPRYNHLLRGFMASSHPWFEQLLWPALFTRNEEDYGVADYRIFLDSLLQALSTDFSPQHTLVAGHMTIRGGYKIIAGNHLRLASGHHARPQNAGNYLIFDAGEPSRSPDDLRRGIGSVFR
jgi:predicted MPP superfamily phosphohydrolase